MAQSISFKPKNFHSITPYIIVNGASKFIDFLRLAFNAEEIARYTKPDSDKIMHAVVKIEDSFIEISDATTEYPAMQTALHLYVPNVDAVYEQAVKAGGKGIMEPRDQFYGDRESFVQDIFGNNWYISTHVKEVSKEEIEKHEAT